jgi:hypothetical protein
MMTSRERYDLWLPDESWEGGSMNAAAGYEPARSRCVGHETSGAVSQDCSFPCRAATSSRQRGLRD